MDLGLLVGRVVLGGLMAGHGAQKLFGWFGGYGLEGTGGFLEQLGFKPGRLFAAVAGTGEFVSGLLVAFGLFGPVGPALMLSVMIVAAFSVLWRHGIFAASNGIEVPLLYASGAAALALIGPGSYSVDAALGFGNVWTPPIEWAVLAVGIMGGIAALASRRTAVSA